MFEFQSASLNLDVFPHCDFCASLLAHLTFQIECLIEWDHRTQKNLECQIHEMNFTNTISKIWFHKTLFKDHLFFQKAKLTSQMLKIGFERRSSMIRQSEKEISTKSSLMIPWAIDFLGHCFRRSFFQTPFVELVFRSSSFAFRFWKLIVDIDNFNFDVYSPGVSSLSYQLSESFSF